MTTFPCMADWQYKQVAASGKKGAFLPLPAAYLYTIHSFPSSKTQNLAIFHITSFVEKPEGLEANVLSHKQEVYMHTCVDTHSTRIASRSARELTGVFCFSRRSP